MSKKHNQLSMKEEYRSKPLVLVTYVILRTIVAAVLVLSILHKNYESAFTCALVLILYLLPPLVQ